MFHEDIISFLISPPDIGWLNILKTLVIIFSLTLFIFIVILAWKANWLKFRILLDLVEFFTYRPFGVKKLTRQWTKILARLESGLESEYKLAVIESDSLFDDILKRMGYSGESLGERLDKITSAVIPDIEGIRQAHKIRNNIVHDPDYRLSLDEARKTLSLYEKALTDLGTL